MRKILIAFIACTVAAGPLLLWAQSARAETKPIAAVAIKSYDQLLSNINFVGELAEKPDLGGAFEGLIALGTQGTGLVGIDKSRPWGVVVQANGDDITGYAFLPIIDGKPLLKLLGLYTTFTNKDGMYKFTPKDGKQEFYGKAQGKWAVFSDKPASLKSVATNPAALLAGTDGQYLVTGRVFLANVPESLRRMAIDKIEEGAKKDLDKKADESEDLHAARTKAVDNIVESVKVAINGMDQITVGWGLDRSAGKLFTEMNLTALAGTPLAEQMALIEKSTSKLAGFELPGQAAGVHIAGPITEMKAGLLNSFITLVRKQALSDAEKNPDDKQELGKDVINSVADLLMKIVKSGRFDMAASASLEPEAALGTIAAHVADGDLLDKTLRKIADAVKENLPPIGDMIKLDADKLGDVKLHTVTIPIGQDAKDREKAVRMFGDEMHIVVGIGTETAYVAAGRDALESLKKTITANAAVGEKSISPVKVSISGEKVATFLSVNGEEKDLEKMKMATEELKTMPGKDHISLVAKSVPHGVKYRLEIEKGLLKTAVKMASEGKN